MTWQATMMNLTSTVQLVQRWWRKLKDKTDDNEPICFNWGKGVPCSQTPCPFKHVWRICLSPSHPTHEHGK